MKLEFHSDFRFVYTHSNSISKIISFPGESRSPKQYCGVAVIRKVSMTKPEELVCYDFKKFVFQI